MTLPLKMLNLMAVTPERGNDRVGGIYYDLNPASQHLILLNNRYKSMV